MALLVQLELVQTAERLSALRADVAARHAGVGFVGGVRGKAAWCERVVRGSYAWSFPCGGLPLRLFIWLPRMCNMRGVSLRVILFLRPVLLRQGSLRSGLKTRRLRNILLILAAVDPVARPLRGQRRDTSRLGSVRNHVSLRMVRECVGILLHHARKVRKTGINVVTFNDGRPELILSFIHGKVRSELSLLPCAVLASILTEARSVLLLLRLDSELKGADVSCKLTRVKQVAEL